MADLDAAAPPPPELAPPEEQPAAAEDAAAPPQQDAPVPDEGDGDHKRKLDEVEEAAAADEDAKRPRVEGDGADSEIAQNNEPSEKVEEAAVDAVASIKGAADAENGKVAAPTEDLQVGSEDKPAEPAMEAVTEAPQEGGVPGVLPDTSRKIDVPNSKVGVLIGKAGDTIRYLQMNSGAQIQITKDADADANAETRSVELVGSLESIDKAEMLIKSVIAEAEAGGSPALIARGFGSGQLGSEQFEMLVPDNKVGLIIGKGGETIKNLQTKSGARIQLIPQHPPEGVTLTERTVRITGNKKQIEAAKEMIKQAMSQVM